MWATENSTIYCRQKKMFKLVKSWLQIAKCRILLEIIWFYFLIFTMRNIYTEKLKNISKSHNSNSLLALSCSCRDLPFYEFFHQEIMHYLLSYLSFECFLCVHSGVHKSKVLIFFKDRDHYSYVNVLKSVNQYFLT